MMPYGSTGVYGYGPYKGVNPQTITPNSILSGEAWGQPTIVPGGVSITPNSITSGEVWGTPTIQSQTVYITIWGIPSEEAWGLPTIQGQMVYIVAIGIPTSEAWGLPSVSRISTPVSALPPPEPVTIGDIRLQYETVDQYVDIIPIDRDIERDPGFETAIIITLGTDKAADVDDALPEDSGYKGGCWMDTVPPVDGFKMGSKLWLLKRAKSEKEIPSMAKEILVDAFKWMIDDLIIDKLEIEVERRRDLLTTLAFSLLFYKPGETPVTYKYFYNWEQQILRRR